MLEFIGVVAGGRGGIHTPVGRVDLEQPGPSGVRQGAREKGLARRFSRFRDSVPLAEASSPALNFSMKAFVHPSEFHLKRSSNEQVTSMIHPQRNIP